jgi:hypothetical protein
MHQHKDLPAPKLRAGTRVYEFKTLKRSVNFACRNDFSGLPQFSLIIASLSADKQNAEDPDETCNLFVDARVLAWLCRSCLGRATRASSASELRRLLHPLQPQGSVHSSGGLNHPLQGRIGACGKPIRSRSQPVPSHASCTGRDQDSAARFDGGVRSRDTIFLDGERRAKRRCVAL